QRGGRGRGRALGHQLPQRQAGVTRAALLLLSAAAGCGETPVGAADLAAAVDRVDLATPLALAPILDLTAPDLAACALPAASIDPNPIDFGAVKVGSTKAF